jgi:exodeoxyribonuclease V beta subunit
MTLDLANDPFAHGLVVEASAGTGKTYSVAAIVTRELALDDDLRIGEILIATFTKSAAAELRDRVRRRLVDTVSKLRGDIEPGNDLIAAQLLVGTQDEQADRIRRLERALVEFDSATISTIHGVCSRVLRSAGMDAGGIIDTDEADRIIEEVVNDMVVNRATENHRWDQKKVLALVKKVVDDPLLELWFDPKDIKGNAISEADAALLGSLEKLLNDCVDRIHGAMTASPSYNDLLRVARELVCDKERADLLAILKSRFRLAIVDEAQDTDRQQWVFFKQLFPGGDNRALMTVGDPKQAIYGFRGADVRAYVDYAKTSQIRRSLDTNHRSDQPVLDALNEAFHEQGFGADIMYHEVHAPADRQRPCIAGMTSSVELIDLGIAGNQHALGKPVLDKVIELLDSGRLVPASDSDGAGRLIEPKDICVLVRSGGVGRIVQRVLVQAGIPAVTGGTSSVMKSSMAIDIRSLLEAMERPSDLGRVRRAAATVFFGHSLTSVGALKDDVIEKVQDGLMNYGGILTKKGIAALGAAIEADGNVMTRIAAGHQGERNITDFLHVMEIMGSEGPRRGCTADQALMVFSRFDTMDEKHDLVSRRVESDADAVKILTIHSAKGLEFPCVIVADLWKEPTAKPEPAVFYDEDGIRKLDIGFGLGMASAYAKARRLEAEKEESKRLLYVAVTRAKHYLAVLVARPEPSKTNDEKRSILEQTMTLPAEMAKPGGRTQLVRKLTLPGATDGGLAVAPAPKVERTYRRVSFTSLTFGRGHRHVDSFPMDERGGGDEPQSTGSDPQPHLPGASADPLPVIDLPAGMAVGRVVHEIFERIDTTQTEAMLEDEVRRVVKERATAGFLKDWHDNLITVITKTLTTPLGGPFGDLTLGGIGPEGRLPEMDFEMGLASLTDGVKASAIGKVLAEMLPADDPLADYAKALAGPAFDVPVGGLLTGSIDAMIRLPESTPHQPRLLLVDYKSNKLHRPGMANPLEAYAPDRLVAAMAESHYPLQALLYGTATYRMLRWRLPEVDPDDCIAGVVYAFIRGMHGPLTPIDERGHRYGVFNWTPPRGLWKRLSDLLVTPALAGAPS